MIKQITKFQTEDGACFNTEKEALQHELRQAFGDWYWYYDKHRLYAGSECVGLGEIIEWLTNNKKEILDFLQKIG